MFCKHMRTLPKRRIRFFVIPVIAASILFIVYQFDMLIRISREEQEEPRLDLIRGTHKDQYFDYLPDREGNFRCILSSEVISFDSINDDYCDCDDGSDEPGTNACPNGKFYCINQKFKNKDYVKVISSQNVNDGICDCCDGSDEWQRKLLPNRLHMVYQKQLQRFQSPCPNVCHNVTDNASRFKII